MKKDAIKDLDGCSLCGERVRLELANVSSPLPLPVFIKTSSALDLDDPAHVTEAATEVAVTIDGAPIAPTELDTLSKSRTCPAESGTSPFSLGN